MQTKKRKIIIILLSIIFLLCTCFCLLSFNKKKAKGVYADSSFTIVDGMSLYTKADSLLGRIAVNLTGTMYSNLTSCPGVEIDGDHFLGFLFDSVKISMPKYYLRLCCSSSLNSFSNASAEANCFTILYHYKPEYSWFPSEQLEFSEDHTQAYLPFTIPMPYSTSYYYYVEFITNNMVEGSYEESNFLGTDEVEECEVTTWPLQNYSVIKSSNYITRSVSYVASRALEYEGESFSTNTLNYFERLAGVTMVSTNFPVKIHYKKSYGFNDIREEVITKNVDSLYALTPSLVFSSVRYLVGFTDISFFNCVYENIISYVDGTVLNTDSRIVSQAIGWNYEFDSIHNAGHLYIEYNSFHYKDFCIKLTDNNLEDDINLSMYLYSTDITANEDCTYTINFDFSTIIHQSFASLGWIFDLTPSNFSVVYNDSIAHTSFSSSGLSVTFPMNNEECLSTLSITALAEIIPDYECTVNLEYKVLSYDGDIEVADDTYSETMMYSEAIVLFNSSSFYNHFQEKIDAGLDIEELEDLIFCEYSNLSVVREEDNIFNCEVIYSYNTLLKISNTLNNTVVYKNLFKNSLTYTFSEFNYSVPSGYRISGLTEYGSNGKLSISFVELDPNTSMFTINTNLHENSILDLRVTLSDKWPVKINYLKRYNDSPFATKETFNGEISFATYSNLDEITGEDIEEIIGEENVKHIVFNEIPIEIVDDSITYEKVGNSYEFNFDYSYTYIKAIDSDGTSDYFNVPLTPFSEWCETFGEDWNIVALAPDVFTYSDEVDKDKLYGFFTVMTFKEQVSNFNSWFEEYTSSGCCNFFSQKQIQGSDFYIFMAEHSTLLPVVGGVTGLIFGHPIIGTAIGGGLELGLLSVSEMIDDENGTYYSYFLYLDGTTDEAYTAHNGATDYNDTSSALSNSVESVGETISNSSIFTVLKIILGIIVAVLLLVLGIKLYGLIKRNIDDINDKK